MNKMDAKEAYDCGRCGLCLLTCPVYQNTIEESFSPRAKVQLSKYYAENNLPGSPHLKDIMSQCLMCGTCTANCPSGVSHEPLFMRMRANMAEDFGENWIMKTLYHFLTHDEQLKLAAKFGKFGRNVVLEKLLGDYRVGTIPVKQMPRMNAQPFRDQLPEINEPEGTCKGTVLYFAGCATNYAYEDVGKAVVQVLTRMGYRVEIPGDQVCCGLPMFIHGAMEKARNNILKNVSILKRGDVKAVIVDCATCGSALRNEYPYVLRELGLETQDAQNLALKIRDVSEFLYEHIEQLVPLLESDNKIEKVTYHNPCHLRNAQGVKDKVESLLARIPGVDFVPVSDADSCCGGGGTFFYDHPEVSKKIVDKKIHNAKKTGASLWATGCPGCQVNLSGNLVKNDQISVVHPIQIVSKALKA
jgi:glycolate dehydrogenase iron-sulfur subunit